MATRAEIDDAVRDMSEGRWKVVQVGADLMLAEGEGTSLVMITSLGTTKGQALAAVHVARAVLDAARLATH